MRILAFRLRYIGDILLLFPALKQIKKIFPLCRLTLLVSPMGEDIAGLCPFVDEILVYDSKNKHKKIKDKLEFIKKIQSMNFDKVFIFQRSFSSALMCFLAGIKERIGFNTEARGFMLTKKIPYRIEAYEPRVFLDVIESIGGVKEELSLFINNREKDIKKMEDYLKQLGILDGDKIAVINASSTSSVKHWSNEKFARIADYIQGKIGYNVFIAYGPGEYNDASEVLSRMNIEGGRLLCETTIGELSAFLQRSHLLISVDSAPLHLGIANNVPSVAIFGPTDPCKWIDLNNPLVKFVKRKIECWPCDYKRCNNNRCMKLIFPEDVIEKINSLVYKDYREFRNIHLWPEKQKRDNFIFSDYNEYKANCKYENFLVIETSTIGEVVLITPVFKTLKEAFPRSHITALVLPDTKEVLEDNPNIDRIVVYNKKSGYFGIREFIKTYKKISTPDVVVLLHRSFRSALIGRLLLPKKVIGTATEGRGFLLTKKVEVFNTEYQHEVLKNMDVLRKTGVIDLNPQLYIKDREVSQELMDHLIENRWIKGTPFFIVNPGAGWNSKRWPEENFSMLCKKIYKKYGVKTWIIFGPGEKFLGERIKKRAVEESILFPETTIKDLISLLGICTVFVTNDTGPMHIASALKTPQIVLMGPTLPEKWGPWQGENRIIYKGCEKSPCCKKDCESGKCMSKITTEEVFDAFVSLYEQL